MPVIPANLELEIRRIMVTSQPGEKSSQDLSSTKISWVWWYTPVILATVGSVNRRIEVQASADIKKETLSQK
jgi:hypothetical protein